MRNFYALIGFSGILFLSACGGGSSTVLVTPAEPTPSREEIRSAVIDGNGAAIGAVARGIVSSMTSASSEALLDTGTDRQAEPVSADSDVRGTEYLQTTFDLGRLLDGVYVIGKTVTDRNQVDDSDYVSYGYWLSVDSTGPASSAGIGVFATGPEFETAPTLPVSGTATYSGHAHGLHTVDYVVGEFGRTAAEFRIGEFDADVTLDADFGAMTMGGRIDNFMVAEEGVRDGSLYQRSRGPRPYFLTLDRGPITGIGSVSGAVSVGKSGTQNIATSSGGWSGQFSSRSIGQGDDFPRLAAGAFAAEWTHTGGTVGRYVGSFIAGKQ